MGIAVWRVTLKPNNESFFLGGGMSVFAQKKLCDYQRSSEHVVTRRGSTGRSTVPYRCTIEVQTHTGPYGVPTGPSGAQSGPDRPPADRRRLRPADFPRRLPGLGGPQLLSAQAGAIVGWAQIINVPHEVEQAR